MHIYIYHTKRYGINEGPYILTGTCNAFTAPRKTNETEVIGSFSAMTGELTVDTTPYWQFGRLDSVDNPGEFGCS